MMTSIEEVSLQPAAADPSPQRNIRLNLGCGRDIKSGWVNIDRRAGQGIDMVVDLEALALNPLPFDDDSVGELYMSHVIEHISNVLPLMEELYRVAKPGAEFIIKCPHGASDDADEDPTHVRRMFPGSFLAFAQPYYWRADYGYRGDWSTDAIDLVVPYEQHKGATVTAAMERIRNRRNQVVEIIATLRAVKPRRAQDMNLMTPCGMNLTMVRT